TAGRIVKPTRVRFCLSILETCDLRRTVLARPPVIGRPNVMRELEPAHRAVQQRITLNALTLGQQPPTQWNLPAHHSRSFSIGMPFASANRSIRCLKDRRIWSTSESLKIDGVASDAKSRNTSPATANTASTSA